MNKFASDLVLKPVLVRDAIVSGEGALVGIVEGLIICPDNGELVGLTIREGFGKRDLKTVTAKEILGISEEFYLIPSYEVLGDLDEIVRLKEIIDMNVPITGNRVYTVGGTYLGKVFDYTIDLIAFKISRIYVKPPLIKGIAKQYIIGYNQIVSIEKDKITVNDAAIKTQESIPARPVITPRPADCSEC